MRSYNPKEGREFRTVSAEVSGGKEGIVIAVCGKKFIITETGAKFL